MGVTAARARRACPAREQRAASWRPRAAWTIRPAAGRDPEHAAAERVLPPASRDQAAPPLGACETMAMACWKTSRSWRVRSRSRRALLAARSAGDGTRRERPSRLGHPAPSCSSRSLAKGSADSVEDQKRKPGRRRTSAMTLWQHLPAIPRGSGPTRAARARSVARSAMSRGASSARARAQPPAAEGLGLAAARRVRRSCRGRLHPCCPSTCQKGHCKAEQSRSRAVLVWWPAAGGAVPSQKSVSGGNTLLCPWPLALTGSGWSCS
jgi:hypothetical protein